MSGAGLLDRDREVAALEGLLAAASRGSGRLVLIEGPAASIISISFS